MKNLSEKFLKSLNPCEEGFQWWVNKDKPKDAIATLKALMADDKFIWVNWLIVRLMTHDQKSKYAIYAAEKVIDISFHKYPDDNRPRNAINAVKKFLKHKTAANKKAAYAAADAAYAAYAAADAAVYAADAADAAAYAAGAAADAAAYMAARKELQTKIIKYGIRLLK